jgi:hypothetical protein
MIFNQKNLPVPGRPTISNKELNDELLDFLIHAVTAETYLIHTGLVFINGINKDLMLNSCGIIRRLIRDCGPPLHLRTGTTITEEDQTARDRLLVRIQVLLGSLNMQVIESVPLNVGADIFMETLLNNLKNETISHQSFMRKTKNEKIIELKKSLNNLKTNYAERSNDILSQENALNSILDLEMRAELEKFRHYDILNTEKMPLRILSLTKNNRKIISLDRIRDGNGAAFESDQQRHAHIHNFYRDIYKKPDGNVLRDNCIEEFLGADICNNEIVRNSKLTREESDFFDTPLSLQELDSAAFSINRNSAGGLDGIGGKFIKKYWAFLRYPLGKYANLCIDTGTLTQSFNSAGIRLIPKKGDVENIKNWRPISLLNCIYKVIAKALDNRLKKVNEIVLSRAQKGFTAN